MDGEPVAIMDFDVEGVAVDFIVDFDGEPVAIMDFDVEGVAWTSTWSRSPSCISAAGGRSHNSAFGLA